MSSAYAGARRRNPTRATPRYPSLLLGAGMTVGGPLDAGQACRSGAEGKESGAVLEELVGSTIWHSIEIDIDGVLKQRFLGCRPDEERHRGAKLHVVAIQD
jgi:hypothetical protein